MSVQEFMFGSLMFDLKWKHSQITPLSFRLKSLKNNETSKLRKNATL